MRPAKRRFAPLVSFPSSAWECVLAKLCLAPPHRHKSPITQAPPQPCRSQAPPQPCRSQAPLGNASRQAPLGTLPLSFPSSAWECVGAKLCFALYPVVPKRRLGMRPAKRRFAPLPVVPKLCLGMPPREALLRTLPCRPQAPLRPSEPPPQLPVASPAPHPTTTSAAPRRTKN